MYRLPSISLFVTIALASTRAHGYQLNKPRTPSTAIVSRNQFNTLVLTTLATLTATPTNQQQAQAFEGGVGGLGKTKPNTGVTFANPDIAIDASSINTPGDYNAEIVAPDGTPVFLSFYAPWPMLKSQGIETRDLANAESSFVQVAPITNNFNGGGCSLKQAKQFFIDTIFGQTGKYGMYGSPTDIKVQKLDDPTTGAGKSDLYLVTFTTLTPGMRESDRKAFISTKVVGDGVFMLVTGTNIVRFRGQESLLRRVADSFECLEAPKSSLRR